MADVSASNWNSTDNSNTDAAPDGAPEGMAPSGVNNGLRAHQGAIKRWYKWSTPATTAGTSTAYTLTYDVAPGALVDGMTHLVQFNATNGAAATLNINSLGAKPLYTYQAAGWAAAPAGVLTANMVSRVAYDSASGTYRVLKVQAAGTWTPSDQSGAGLTFTSVTGHYQVLGNMVFAYFTLTFPSTADGSNVSIGGLPITIPNQNYATFDSPINANTTSATLAFRPVKNTTTFNIFNQQTFASSVNSAWSGDTIEGCIMYPAS
jgi:hypothetical protein